jgi:hypothetical protein
MQKHSPLFYSLAIANYRADLELLTQRFEHRRGLTRLWFLAQAFALSWKISALEQEAQA